MITQDKAADCGAVDQRAFAQAIRDHLSPAGMAAIVAFLRPAESYRPCDPDRQEAFAAAARQVAWLADTLAEMLGVQEFNRLIDEIGL